MGTPNLAPMVFGSTLTWESRMNNHHSTVSTSSLISTAVSRWRSRRLSEMVMTMHFAHDMPRGNILILSFLNSHLIINLIMRGMPWQIKSLPICQSWQSLAGLRREGQLLGQSLLFQSSVQRTFTNTHVLGQLTTCTFKCSECLYQRALIERGGSRGLRRHHDEGLG